MRPFLGAVPITQKPILGCRSGESTVGCIHDDFEEEDELPGRMAGRNAGRSLDQGSAPVCPTSAPTSYDPTLNCMRDARGNAICSDGVHYPPGCPHTPPDQYFTPGVTPDITTGGRIEGQIPPPRAAGSAGGGSSLLVPIAVGSAALLAAVGYFTFR